MDVVKNVVIQVKPIISVSDPDQVNPQVQQKSKYNINDNRLLPELPLSGKEDYQQRDGYGPYFRPVQDGLQNAFHYSASLGGEGFVLPIIVKVLVCVDRSSPVAISYAIWFPGIIFGIKKTYLCEG